MTTETVKNTAAIDQLNGVLHHLKETFVGKDDIIDLMGICLVGRENLFLLGPIIGWKHRILCPSRGVR